MAGPVSAALVSKADAGGADVVGVEAADLVVLDLADEGGAGAETGKADDGVGAGAAAHLGRRAHVLVDRGGAGLVDQRHAALGHAVAGEKTLVGLHQHVENRIADPENVVFCVSHPSVLFTALCEEAERGQEGCGLPDRPRASKAAPHARNGFAVDPVRSGASRRVSKDAGPSVAASFETRAGARPRMSGLVALASAGCCYTAPPMIRSFLTVSSGTLASRLLGFVRDSALAALLGAGAVADAFLAAFQLVNVVRRLLTEGGLNAALVPAWLRVRETDGAVAAAAFAGRVLGTVTTALIAATAVLALVMPLVMTALAPGFSGRETLQLATDNARLMLPYLAFAGPVTVMMALLNAQGRFALTAFSPLLFNIALIAVMVVLLAVRPDAVQAAQIVAATVGIAGLLQLSVLVLRRGESIAAPLRISFDKEIRGFLAKAAPGMMASSAPQLLMVAGAIIASSSPSAVSWLYFANRLVELPLGIVGVAMGTVLIPELTRAVRGEDRAAVAHAELRGLELAVGLALPATLGLIVLSEPIVRLLFEHGAFTADDTEATARALMWLTLALPAHVLVKALSPAFFAREDTMTPLVSALKGVVLAIAAAFLLSHWYGADGIAAAIALGAWSMAFSLIRRGAETFGFSIDAEAQAAAAAHRARGARHGRAAVAGDTVAAGARLGRARLRAGRPAAGRDSGGNCDLRPVLKAFRRHRLARGG